MRTRSTPRAPSGLEGSLTAVDLRPQLRQEPRQAERNRTLVEQLPQVTYIEQLDGQSASYISPQIEALVGYSPEEWTADPEFFGKLLHPDDRERVLTDFAQMHLSRDRFECEYRLVTRDQRIVWIHDGAVVVRDDAGLPIYAQGFMVDISARKTAGMSSRWPSPEAWFFNPNFSICASTFGWSVFNPTRTNRAGKPDSFRVGTSGRSNQRCSPVIAIARSAPDLICAWAGGSAVMPTVVVFPSSAAMAGPAPL